MEQPALKQVVEDVEEVGKEKPPERKAKVLLTTLFVVLPLTRPTSWEYPEVLEGWKPCFPGLLEDILGAEGPADERLQCACGRAAATMHCREFVQGGFQCSVWFSLAACFLSIGSRWPMATFGRNIICPN